MTGLKTPSVTWQERKIKSMCVGERDYYVRVKKKVSFPKNKKNYEVFVKIFCKMGLVSDGKWDEAVH